MLHRAPQGYSFPTDVADAVLSVDGVVRLPHLRATPTLAKSLMGKPFPADTCGGKCSGHVTPAILTERYKLGDAPTKNSISNRSSMAVAEFQDQGWDQKDCNKLAEACKTENITVEKQVGGLIRWTICRGPPGHSIHQVIGRCYPAHKCVLGTILVAALGPNS